MSDQSKYLEAIRAYGGNFTENEFLPAGGNITDLDYEFFVEFLKFRQWSGKKTLITSAYRPGDDGAHGLGFAYDYIQFDHWLERPTKPKELWLLATTWPFMGVGIYFDWEYTNKDGEKEQAVGIHADGASDGRPLRWLRVTRKVGEKKKRLYYYQNRYSGWFYNKETQDVLSLEQAIHRHWNPK